MKSQKRNRSRKICQAISMTIVGPARLSIGARMLSGFLAVVLLMGAIVATSLLYFSRLESSLRELLDEEFPEVHALWEIRGRITEIEVELYDILAEQRLDPSVPAIVRQYEAIDDLLVHYVDLHGSISPKSQQILDQFGDSFERLKASSGNVLALAEQQRWPEANTIFRDQTKALNDAALIYLGSLLTYENDEVSMQSLNALTAGESGRRTLSALFLAGVAVSVALVLVLTRSVTRPIMKLVASTERAAAGDLAARAEVMGRDEIGRLAERFNEMLDRLVKSISDQKQFYADASHELRTPITVIRGESEVALRGPDSLEGYREALQNVAAAASQMTILVDELLFLARSEAGQVEYHMLDLEFGSLLREVVDMSEGLAGIKGVGLRLGEVPSVRIEGDRQRLRQLFLNLLDNAIKYTPAGGQVSVAGTEQTDQVSIEVSDTGIGVASGEVPRVFERFFRGEIAKSASERGTGLGLSIADSIARAHGGSIDIHSEPNKGTRVVVALPRPSG